MTKVAAWVSPDKHQEYSKKHDDMIMVFSIMDTIEKENKEATKDKEDMEENLLYANQFKYEKNHGFLPPLRPNSSWSKEAAHLYREICECGKRRFWGKKSDEQDEFQNLLNFSPRISPTPPSWEERLDQLFTIVLIFATVIVCIALFFVRNIDLIF